MKAKKSLGQHFLTSQKALFEIVAAGNISKNDIVLEIGPGKGVLTEKLLEQAEKVIAIEKDAELIPFLQEKFKKEIRTEKLILLQRDILTFDPSILKKYKKPYKLIANIPYYITGAIIEQFLSTNYQPSTMVLLLQKEVAERIVAKDGKESVLSIAVRVFGSPKIIAKVPRGAFSPAPKVDSAIIAIENISRAFFENIDEKRFFSILKHCFGQKRKQLIGSLSDLLEDRTKAKSILQIAEIKEQERPEKLSLKKWGSIAQALS